MQGKTRSNQKDEAVKFTFEVHSDTCCISFRKSKSAKATGSFWTELERTIFRAEFLKFTNLKIEDRVYYKLLHEHGVACTNLTLVLYQTIQGLLKFLGKQYHRRVSVDNFPGTLALDFLEDFGIMLQTLKLCKANYDFTNVLAKCTDMKVPFPGVESERIALAESSNGHGQLIKENFDIVRHVNCEYIVKGKTRCQHCSIFSQG